MIELVGGALNQWDTGRTVAYSGEAQKLEFCNKGDSLALAVDVSRGAGIPDRFLQSGRDLFVFAVKVDEDNHEQTVEVKRFTVHNRPKPKNYLPTEAEEALGELKKITQAALEAAAKAEAAANVMTVTVGEGAFADKTSSEIYAHVCAGGDVYLMDYYLCADGWMWSLLHATEELAVFGGLEGTNLYFARIDINGEYSEFVISSDKLAYINDFSTTDNAWSAKKILEMIAQGGTGDINMGGRSILGVSGLFVENAEGTMGAGFFPAEHEDDGGTSVVELYGVSSDQPVRLRRLAPGVQGDDAVNMDQLKEATKNAGSSLLIVRLPEDESVGFASHHAGEIYSHIQNGGAVIAYDPVGDRYLSLFSCDFSMMEAVFVANNAGTEEMDVYTVFDDGTVSHYSRALVDQGQLNDTVGDIEKALDAIIAIQEELIGIITFTVNGNEYRAIDGMTWGAWVDSKYNIDGFTVEEGYVCDADVAGFHGPDGNLVTPNMVIIAGASYGS